MLWCHPCSGDSGKTQGQHLGIDRVIQLGSGKTLYIDEKKRDKDYKDFFLEYESIGPHYYAKGWIEKDLFIDYLAYAFFPSRQCYLLPWLMLKTAWLIHGSGWKKRYPVRTGENASYGTYGVCVPIPVVLNAIKGMMFVQLPDNTG